MTTEEQLQELIELLKLERQADIEWHREKVLQRSLKERVDKGTARFPLRFQRLDWALGDRLMLEMTQDQRVKANDIFQPGGMVSVFGMLGDEEVGRISGVLAAARPTSMRVALSGKKMPDWLQKADLGVDVEFDDRTYRDMERAVREVMNAPAESRISELREILLGQKKASFSEWELEYGHPDLNESQNKAVLKALEAKDVALIHGPPGTGKTTTMVEVIRETLLREHQVLICAPSNAAVDLLTLKCLHAGMEVLRLGNPVRVEEELQIHTLDGAVQEHQDYQALRKLRKDADKLERQAGKKKRGSSRENYRRKRELFREVREIRKLARQLEDYIIHQLLSHTPVIAATLTGVAHSVLGGRRFHTVFIDEAAQALTPAALIAVLRADRVIMAGDHYQLPPTVKSAEAASRGLERTLFEITAEKPRLAQMLEVQYRMNEQIMAFPGEKFYSGRLEAHPSVAHHHLPGEEMPFEFIDTAGCGFDEYRNPETLSTSNQEEANLLLRHLAGLMVRLESHAAEELEEGKISFGVIAPYKEQVKLLRQQLRESPLLGNYSEQLDVNTVDGFQGQERDVIYISLVRSNQKGEIGFLSDIRRTNVAMTRARKKLVIVGDSATLGEHSFYADLVAFAEENGAYRSAWELIGTA